MFGGVHHTVANCSYTDTEQYTMYKWKLSPYHLVTCVCMYAGCRIHMIMSLDNFLAFMIYTSFSISSSYIQVTSICMCVCLYICDRICENPPCRELCAIIFTGVLLSPVIKSRNQYFCRYERINLSSYVQTNQNGLT